MPLQRNDGSTNPHSAIGRRTQGIYLIEDTGEARNGVMIAEQELARLDAA